MAQPSGKVQNTLNDEFKRVKVTGNFRKEDFTDELVDCVLHDVRYKEGGDMHRVLTMKWKAGPDLDFIIPKKKDSKTEYVDPENTPGYTDMGKFLDRLEAKGFAVYGLSEFRAIKTEPDIRGSVYSMKVRHTTKTGAAASKDDADAYTNWDCDDIVMAKNPAQSAQFVLVTDGKSSGSSSKAPKAPASNVTKKQVQEMCIEALKMMPAGEWATKIDLMTNLLALQDKAGMPANDRALVNNLKDDTMDILVTAGAVQVDVGEDGAPLYILDPTFKIA